MRNRVIGLVGLGLLGRGIAASVLGHGHRLITYSLNDATAAAAESAIEGNIRELIERGGFPQALASQWRSRWTRAGKLSEFAQCEFVIESITENMDSKQSVYDELEAAIAPAVPIASNTSAIPITLIQKGRKVPARFVGMHWAEPAHATRFLEIIRGEETSEAAFEAAHELGLALDKEPSLVRKDVRGFVTNRLMYAMMREAMHLHESGVADVETIDRSFRNDIGWWATIAGPFRMMDLAGPAAFLAVARDLYPQLSNASVVAPSLENLVKSGGTGVGNGRGFYSYSPEESARWGRVWHDFTWDIRALAQKYPQAAPAAEPANPVPPPTPGARRPVSGKSSSLRIERITATPVLVPSNPDSIMSPDIQDDWSKSTGIGKTSGGSTAKFPDLPKYILRAYAQNGSIGIGETYRAVEIPNLERNARAILGRDLLTLSLANLPIPMDREYDGFELLAYDLVGKALGASASVLLGGRFRDKVECSMWTGRRNPPDAGRKAWEGMQRGFDCIKFKCNDQDDVAAWAWHVRDRCGEGMKMIFDPNQRWGDYGDARRIMESLKGFNVLCIEDPIARDRYADYRRLRGVGGMKVVTHVSLPYCVHGQHITDAIKAIREDCCDGFNFNGSMASFVMLAGLGALDDKPCWHGSEVDLGILEAGYVHAAAASPSCIWPSDIFGRLVREHDLLTAPLTFEGKHVLVPEGPGLGVELDAQAIEKYRGGPDLEWSV